MASSEWIQKRIKAILYHYGDHFFNGKKILDIGAGHGEVSIAMANLGAVVTALDARKNYLDAIKTRNPSIRCVRADLDQQWPFNGEFFDVIIHLGTLNHLQQIEMNLKNVCNSTTNLILESQVCDSTDVARIFLIKENKSNTHHSFNGVGARPSTRYIESALNQLGMEYSRIIDDRCNAEHYIYDWNEQNSNSCREGLSRLWFAKRHNHLIPPMFDSPELLASVIAAPEAAPANAYSYPITAPIPLLASIHRGHVGKKRFVIVIPSYKNERWCEQNIISTINQNYDKYRVIFTDDASPDNTFNKVSQAVNSSRKAGQFTLVKNPTRLGALANLYNMIHSCDDDEIVLTLDGDDWFPHENVLSRLDEIYSDSNVWMTYGQYKNHPDGQIGIAAQYPVNVVDSTSFRSQPWGASHLRTFYTWLFKNIKKEDFLYNGGFMAMAWDMTIMFPMLEMAGPHSKFVSDILYTYNMENPINDHKVDKMLQQSLDRYVRTMPKYPISSGPPDRAPAVGLMLIATGKYDRYVQGFIASADKYFLNRDYDVTYYVFTDAPLQIQSSRNVVLIPIDHKPFPYASMDRFKHFTNHADKFSKEDYLYYFDVDSLLVDEVGSEIVGDLVGVRHCGFVNDRGPYENNAGSVLYVNTSYPVQYKNYFGGGLSGGRKRSYLQMAKWCCEMIERDLANGIVPIFHDETALNRYFLDHEPDIILSPSYHHPQSNMNHYKKLWRDVAYPPKVLLLDKDHASIRS